MKKANQYILIVSLVLALPVILFAFCVIRQISFSFAQQNPEIAYMRVPLLSLCYVILTCVAFALMIGLILVTKSLKQNIFTPSTTRCLKGIARLSAIAFVSTVAMYLYSYSQIQSEVGLVGGYMILFGVIVFAAMNLLYFLTFVFEEAVALKEDNELTV